MLSSALLVLLSAVLLLHSLAAAQLPQSIADVEIASITGCVDVHPVTVNCSVATTTLRIQTAAGFPASIDLYNHALDVSVRLGDYLYFITTTAWPDTSDPTNSSVFVNVTAGAYYPHITDQLISVSILDHSGGGLPVSSPPFDGFSYRFEGPPTLTSIGGCEGSGESTLNCLPDSAVIELRGSGLLWYSTGRGVRLTIGGQTTQHALGNGAVQLLQVVNDSYAVLPLEPLFSLLLRRQHYAGVLLPLNLTSTALGFWNQGDFSYTTNSLYISFVPLPLPVITEWEVRGCNVTGSRDNATLRYISCQPAVAQLVLSGYYFYDAQVSVGGVSCPNANGLSSWGTSYNCRLPNFDFDPSTAYDVVLSNDSGNVTLSGVVQYAPVPTLVSIDPCVDRGDAQSSGTNVLCPVGATITLRGSRFPAADAVTVLFTPRYQSVGSVSLLAATLINSSTITATLPPLEDDTAAATYGQYGDVQAVFTSSTDSTLTNPLGNTLYIAPDAPNITSITSTMCDTVSPLQLTNCRAMAAITVTGINLFTATDQSSGRLWLSTWQAGVMQGYNYLMPSIASINLSHATNTSFVFSLKYFDVDTNVALLPDVVYILLIESDNHSKLSNAFRVSLTYGVTASASNGSSISGLSSGAVAGIVIAVVVVAVLLVLAVVWLVRWTGSSPSWTNKSGDSGVHLSEAQHSSGDYQDVELH